MADKLHFSLVSPERELFSGAVDQVDAPGADGDFGVFAHHAPFMTALKPGIIRVHNDGAVSAYQIDGGFADVTPEGVTILAERASPTTVQLSSGTYARNPVLTIYYGHEIDR